MSRKIPKLKNRCLNCPTKVPPGFMLCRPCKTSFDAANRPPAPPRSPAVPAP